MDSRKKQKLLCACEQLLKSKEISKNGITVNKLQNLLTEVRIKLGVIQFLKVRQKVLKLGLIQFLKLGLNKRF